MSKDVVSVSESEMLLSNDGTSIVYLGEQNKKDTLEKLLDVRHRASELFKFTYRYLMSMQIPISLHGIRHEEYNTTSSLLLRSLDDFRKVVPECDPQNLFNNAQSEVETRLYGKTIKSNVNEELFNGSS